jgi:hypothetical protein
MEFEVWGWVFVGILAYCLFNLALSHAYGQGRKEERENWESWLRSEFDAKRLVYLPKGKVE